MASNQTGDSLMRAGGRLVVRQARGTMCCSLRRTLCNGYGLCWAARSRSAGTVPQTTPVDSPPAAALQVNRLHRVFAGLESAALPPELFPTMYRRLDYMESLLSSRVANPITKHRNRANRPRRP